MASFDTAVDKPRARKVSLRHLLSYTNGLPQPDEVIPGFYQRADIAPGAVALAKRLAVEIPPRSPGTSSRTTPRAQCETPPVPI